MIWMVELGVGFHTLAHATLENCKLNHILFCSPQLLKRKATHIYYGEGKLKDPTVPSAADRKKIMFYDSVDKQTRLRIRCDIDGITQSQFFRMMIDGYINNDDHIFNYIKNFKRQHGLQGQSKISKIDAARNKSKDTISKFSLNDDEVHDIFDIIEMETDL